MKGREMEAIFEPSLKTSYNVEDLWDISHRYPDKRFELVQGELVERMPTGMEHGVISLKIGAFIMTHALTNQLGYSTAAETGYILGHNPETGKPTVLAPDVGFIRRSRLAEMPTKYCPLPPDLAVEVVSPSNADDDITQKVRLYLQAGTQLVWVVYPKTQTIAVHSPSGIITLNLDDTLDGGEVLPTFRLALKTIFGE